jgi:hypothetical protein
MNLPLGYVGDLNEQELLIYKTGHKDARHAAAELVITYRLLALVAQWREQRRLCIVALHRGDVMNDERQAKLAKERDVLEHCADALDTALREKQP